MEYIVRRSLIFLVPATLLLASPRTLASTGESPGLPVADDEAGSAEFPGMTASPVRMSVMINGHWKGYSWLRIRDDGEPCALVSHWLEWGITSTTEFVPDSATPGHGNCVQPLAPRSRAPLVMDAEGQSVDDAHQAEGPGGEEAGTAAQADDEPAAIEWEEDDEDDEPVVRRRYDAQRHQLKVRVRDTLMSRARGDVPFSRYDDGVNAVRLDYRISGSRSERALEDASVRDKSLYATLNPGINVGPWRVRSTLNYAHDTALQIDGVREPRWTRDNTYLTRDLGRWRSRLLIGEGYTDSLLFTSIPFTGVQLGSEDSLLPDYLEAFTPVVRGVASSNAEVMVRQGGVLFYHTSVAPGPFVLYDVRPPSTSGDIRVTVREADGTEHVSIVPYTAMPLLTHGKVWKYAVNAGRYRPLFGNQHPDDVLLQATAGYGLPAKLSAYAGVLATHGYDSGALGVGWDLDKGGAVSLDVTQSRVRQPIADPTGRQWRLRYAKSIATTGTGVAVDYRRFEGGQFRTLESKLERDRQVDFWKDLVGPGNADEWVTETRARSQLRMELKQNVGDTGNVYATFIRSDYASRTPRRFTAQVGMTWYGERFDLDLQANHRRVGRMRDTSAQLSLSVPLGKVRGNTLRYAASADRDEAGGLTWNNRLAGSGMRDYRLNYVLDQQRAHHDASKRADSVRVSYQADAARMSVGHTRGSGNRRTDASIEGSIIGWSGGLALGQPLGETVGIVDAPGYSGASIDGQMATRTDARGRAVVSYLTPYRVNRLGLDSIKLGDAYDYDSLFREVVPTSGAVLVVPINPVEAIPLLP